MLTQGIINILEITQHSKISQVVAIHFPLVCSFEYSHVVSFHAQTFVPQDIQYIRLDQLVRP